jgi:uncharacterized membrane protein
MGLLAASSGVQPRHYHRNRAQGHPHEKRLARGKSEPSRRASGEWPLMRGFVTQKRSLVKAVTYRILIMVMDLTTIYLFTGGMRVAIGFTLASNIYTSAAYIFHERIWARIGWASMIFAGWSRAGS